MSKRRQSYGTAWVRVGDDGYLFGVYLTRSNAESGKQSTMRVERVEILAAKPTTKRKEGGRG